MSVKLKRSNPPKMESVLETARECIESGKYLATFHAECRQLERDITLLDALHVIKHGFREPKYDQFKEDPGIMQYEGQPSKMRQ